MTRPQYSIHLPMASSTEIEHTARRLKKTREEFLMTGTSSQHPPRRMIMESWQRCREMQVNASLRYAPLAVTHDVQIQNAREAAQQLINAAQPVMKYLAEVLAGSGYVIVLSDAAGCLLDVMGDKKVRRRLERIDFGPGGDWSEAAAGTNALGTAITDGHVVQLLGAEHYCEGWQDLTCTAAPIRHPQTGEILGILDTTGNYRLIRPFLSCFVATMALQVQQEISARLATENRGKTQAKAQAMAFKSSESITYPARAPADGQRQRMSEVSPEALTENMAYSVSADPESNMQHGKLLVAAMNTISNSLDIDVTLAKVAEQTAYLLGLNSAAVYLFGKNEESEVSCVWSRQHRRRVELGAMLEELQKHAEVLALLQERGEPVIIDDTYPFIIHPRKLAEQSNLRSLLLLPLITVCGVIGFIMIPRYTRFRWSVNDMLPGLMFAAHAAIAIENVQLQRGAKETEALREIEQLKSKFVTAVSHDLQSPLTAIRASVEGLLKREEMNGSDTQKHLLNTIAGQTNRLDRLVGQLLDLSRIEAGMLALDCDWIDLPVLIADTAEKFEELYRGYRVEREIAGELPLLYVDRERFVQVLWNLLENARKYAASVPIIRIEARQEGNEIQIGVADRGPGIPEEEREKIFQHFYRLKRDQRSATEGSGLGLAICQGIVQAHGGRIWLEERAGGGSIFRFTLPLPTTELSGIELPSMSTEGK